MEHFDHEGFELGLGEESLSARIVLVEVDFELVPNGVDEGEFLGGDVAGCLDLEAAAVQIDSVSEVLSDEVEVLLEGNEPIVISVQFLEYIKKILFTWSYLDERPKLCEQLNKLGCTDLYVFPILGIILSIFSLEDYFSEVYRKNEGNKLFKSNRTVTTFIIIKIFHHYV